MRKLLILYFISCFNLLLASRDRIDFFDVGQGHCALVTRDGSHNERPCYPLLIDAGSRGALPILVQPDGSQVDLKGTTGGKDAYLVPQIVQAIKKHWGSENEFFGLSVIISHQNDKTLPRISGLARVSSCDQNCSLFDPGSTPC